MPANAICDAAVMQRVCVDVFMLVFAVGELLTLFALPCIFNPCNVQQTHFPGCTLSPGESLQEKITILLRQPTCFIK